MVSPFMTATMVRDMFDDEDFVFDFNPLMKANVVDELGGQAIPAQILQFPALVNNGVSQVLLTLEPCGMNAPHVHPRGTEILFAIDGEFLSIFVEENGSDRVVDNVVKPFQSTFFPMGVIHTQVNLSCEPASFIASFNSEDPGLVTVLQ
jgi:oxalate decarboxylase/phosphoglucose isomerase-like protein (cupin superfamily)